MSLRHVPPDFSTRVPSPLERILVAIAGDAGDERVLAAAGALSAATGASLHLVHASEPTDADWALGAGGPARGEGDEAIRREALGRLPAGTRVTVESRRGPAHRVICEAAERTAPHLLVLGATRSAGKLLGSTAERVVRKATVPVLVVRRGLAVPPRRVLAPLDLSRLSACGFHCGLAMASRFAAGAEIRATVLFAVGLLDPMAHQMREEGWSRQELETRAGARLEELVAEHLPDIAVNVETRVVLGPAREAILAAAADPETDLVVMSTHGYGGFERLVLGSVAATIVREAPCSVLLVPPEAGYRDEIAEAVLSQTAPFDRSAR
jgi:nucleotide-binding universal stress UspA family protein